MSPKVVLRHSLLVVASSLCCSCGSLAPQHNVGIEEAKYAVLRRKGNFEIRRYAAQVVSETGVDGDFEQAGNIAFERLYGYISGNNRKRESIAMTAPVEQQSSGEKIAMTAPVEQVQTGDKYVVRFLMPARYTLETLPKPLDPEVSLIEIPPRTMAAVRYSGNWDRQLYERKRESLLDFIADEGLNPTGRDIFARYDPPFQLPFLRRNEVLIPIE